MNKKQLIELMTRFKDDADIAIAVFEKNYAEMYDHVISISDNNGAIQFNVRGDNKEIKNV